MDATELTTEQAAEARKALYTEIGLNYAATFVPQSVSRNAGEKRPTINWRVSLTTKSGSLTTDYMQGIGHIPGYYTSNSRSNDRASLEWSAANKGKYWQNGRTYHELSLPAPALDDVLYSLISDSAAIDAGCFEYWAEEYGYDTDSREAEATYRACLEIAQQLRTVLGYSVMSKLRELFQDY